MSEKNCQITVARAQGRTTKVIVEDGAAVEIVLQGAGITLKTSEGVNVNGAPATMEQPVKDGDIVTVSQGAKGA